MLHDFAGDPDGPLAGVKAGLTWALERGAQTLAVSPCDAPLLPEDLYVRLVALPEQGAAMAETVEGRQPLCAVWPVSALPVVAEALADGQHPPTWRVLEQVGAVKVLFDPPAAFANLNTREELARWSPWRVTFLPAVEFRGEPLPDTLRCAEAVPRIRRCPRARENRPSPWVVALSRARAADACGSRVTGMK